MRIVSMIGRLLLGLVFTVFGLNGFLHFIPMQPMPPVAVNFFTALGSSPYMSVIFALEVVGGVLMLVNKFVPLGLTLLAPILVNILLVHIFMVPAGLPVALVTTVFWLLAYWPVRDSFAGLLKA